MCTPQTFVAVEPHSNMHKSSRFPIVGFSRAVGSLRYRFLPFKRGAVFQLSFSDSAGVRSFFPSVLAFFGSSEALPPPL